MNKTAGASSVGGPLTVIRQHENMINLHDDAIDKILPKIGAKSFAVMLVITKHMGQNGQSWPGVQTIMKKTGLGRDVVRNAVKVLVENKLISKSQRHVKGKFSSNMFKVKTPLFKIYVDENKRKKPRTENQFTVTGKPSSEKPSSEKPSSEKPSSEKPALSIEQSLEVLNPLEVLNKGGSSHARENEAAAANPPFPKNGRAIPTGATSANAPKEKSSAKKEKVIWSESEYTGAEGLVRLENDLIDINPDYDLVDVDYYRERVVVWSMTAKHSKFDWLGLIHKIIREDSNQQKLKTKPHVRQKSNNEVILDNLNRVLAAKGY